MTLSDSWFPAEPNVMEPVISGGKIVFIKRALLTKSGKSMVQKIVHQVLPPLSTQRSFMYVGKGYAREKFIFSK